MPAGSPINSVMRPGIGEKARPRAQHRSIAHRLSGEIVPIARFSPSDVSSPNSGNTKICVNTATA